MPYRSTIHTPPLVESSLVLGTEVASTARHLALAALGTAAQHNFITLVCLMCGFIFGCKPLNEFIEIYILNSKEYNEDFTSDPTHTRPGSREGLLWPTQST